MSEVFGITVCSDFGKDMIQLDSVEAIAGKGIVEDRYFKKNENTSNITLIEKENIDLFNKNSSRSIPYQKFRRNIITKGIRLNSLVGREIFIGSVKIKVHELCQPCLKLQKLLGQNNFVKDMTHKSGIRCEILIGGKIGKGNKITY
jgi:MOSC domain-containing protein YiiM